MENLMIDHAQYLGGHKLLLTFSNRKQRIVDMYPILLSSTGTIKNSCRHLIFRKFKMVNGNVSWGENDDVIFPVTFLYNMKPGAFQKDEVLYVL
jgi:hypothetical protein